MAYSVVPTVATGDVWTAAYHNTYIRDNFAAGVPGLLTTKGDLAVATGVMAAGRLAIGPEESILVPDSSTTFGMKWNMRDIVLVKRTTSYTFESPSNILLPFENLIYDNGSHWSIADPKTINILADGIYLIVVTMNLANYSPPSNFFCKLLIDGAAIYVLSRYSTSYNWKLNLAFSGHFIAGNKLSVEIPPQASPDMVVVDANNPCGLALVRLI